MSFAQTIVLGALAGFTIYLGLPVGRLQLLGLARAWRWRCSRSGVLAFIFVDVLSNGIAIVNSALDSVKHHHGSVAYLVWLVVLLGVGFAAGSAGLAVLERRMRPLGGAEAPDRRWRGGRRRWPALRPKCWRLELDAARAPGAAHRV